MANVYIDRSKVDKLMRAKNINQADIKNHKSYGENVKSAIFRNDKQNASRLNISRLHEILCDIVDKSGGTVDWYEEELFRDNKESKHTGWFLQMKRKNQARPLSLIEITEHTAGGKLYSSFEGVSFDASGKPIVFFKSMKGVYNHQDDEYWFTYEARGEPIKERVKGFTMLPRPVSFDWYCTRGGYWDMEDREGKLEVYNLMNRDIQAFYQKTYNINVCKEWQLDGKPFEDNTPNELARIILKTESRAYLTQLWNKECSK